MQQGPKKDLNRFWEQYKHKKNNIIYPQQIWAQTGRTNKQKKTHQQHIKTDYHFTHLFMADFS